MAIGAPVFSDDEDAALSDDDGGDNDTSFGYDPNFTSALAMTPKERASMVPSAGRGVMGGSGVMGSLGRGRGGGDFLSRTCQHLRLHPSATSTLSPFYSDGQMSSSKREGASRWVEWIHARVTSGFVFLLESAAAGVSDG